MATECRAGLPDPHECHFAGSDVAFGVRVFDIINPITYLYLSRNSEGVKISGFSMSILSKS